MKITLIVFQLSVPLGYAAIFSPPDVDMSEECLNNCCFAFLPDICLLIPRSGCP